MVTLLSLATYTLLFSVFIRIVAAATINFSLTWVRLLIEGGFYPFRSPIPVNLRFCIRLNNNSLAAVRVLIRKPGPHSSRGPVGTLK